MLKNLIIACSPRSNGNSDIMAQTAYDTFTLDNLQSEIIYLRELSLSPCIACNGCQKTGICVLRDDMQDIYPKLLSAQNIIISAPIYFQGLGAMAKAFIDRAQPFWNIKYILNKKVIENDNLRAKRKTLALLCGGTNFPNTFTCAENTIKIFSLMLEAKYQGGAFFPLIEEKGDILKDQENLAIIKDKVLNLIG